MGTLAEQIRAAHERIINARRQLDAWRVIIAYVVDKDAAEWTMWTAAEKEYNDAVAAFDALLGRT